MTRNKFGLSRDIPADIARAVRQRCGFCCVICGAALCDYEHFAPEFKDCREHKAEGITLLCTEHHRGKGGSTPLAEIVESNSDPYAFRDGSFATRHFFISPPYAVRVGSNTLYSRNALVWTYSEPQIWLTRSKVYGKERVVLNAEFRKADGAPLLRIEEGVLQYRPWHWDIESKTNEFSILSKKGEFDIRIKFNDGKIHFDRLDISYFDVRIVAQPDGEMQIYRGGRLAIAMADCTMEGGMAAIAIM